MGKTKVVNTPIGKITVGPNTVPSEEATKTINQTKTEFTKIANSGTVPVDKLRDDATEHFYK